MSLVCGCHFSVACGDYIDLLPSFYVYLLLAQIDNKNNNKRIDAHFGYVHHMNNNHYLRPQGHRAGAAPLQQAHHLQPGFALQLVEASSWVAIDPEWKSRSSRERKRLTTQWNAEAVGTSPAAEDSLSHKGVVSLDEHSNTSGQ
jgi:hypothetical protein